MKLRYRLLAYPTILAVSLILAFRTAGLFGETTAGAFGVWLLLLWAMYRFLRKQCRRVNSSPSSLPTTDGAKSETQRRLAERLKDFPKTCRNFSRVRRALLFLLWGSCTISVAQSPPIIVLATATVLTCVSFMAWIFYGWSLSPYRRILLAPWFEGVNQEAFNLRSIAEFILAVAHMFKGMRRVRAFLARLMVHWYVFVFAVMLVVEVLGFAALYMGIEKLAPGSFVLPDGHALAEESWSVVSGNLLEFSVQKLIPLGSASAFAKGWLARLAAIWESLIGLFATIFFVGMFVSQHPQNVENLERIEQAIESGQLWLRMEQPKAEQSNSQVAKRALESGDILETESKETKFSIK